MPAAHASAVPRDRARTALLSTLLVAVAVAGAVVLASCASSSSKSNDAPTLTGDALMDPNNCLPCHADQFREWAGSMHAYAAEDPSSSR